MQCTPHAGISTLSLHDALPIYTAGLRDAPDEVERIGISRAWDEIQKADRVLLMVDGSITATDDPEQIWPEFVNRLEDRSKITVIRNKCDLTSEQPVIGEHDGHTLISLSAKADVGIDNLRQHLKDCMGYANTTEGGFLARHRHIDALNRAESLLLTGQEQLIYGGAGELLAEDLRQAQQHLSEITGEFSSDDLLGRIFSSFCIGK